MTDVPPEIKKLREQSWVEDSLGLAGLSNRAQTWLFDAEAAVLACEERMKHDLLDRDLEATALRAERDSERQRTVAEIVTELRGIASDFGNGECDHPAVAEAADLIEQRFGAKEEEDDDAVS